MTTALLTLEVAAKNEVRSILRIQISHEIRDSVERAEVSLSRLAHGGNSGSVRDPHLKGKGLFRRDASQQNPHCIRYG